MASLITLKFVLIFLFYNKGRISSYILLSANKVTGYDLDGRSSICVWVKDFCLCHQCTLSVSETHQAICSVDQRKADYSSPSGDKD
jgi:hypothetical protein